MRISDWSSDVCSSDLQEHRQALRDLLAIGRAQPDIDGRAAVARGGRSCGCRLGGFALLARRLGHLLSPGKAMTPQWGLAAGPLETDSRSEEHTSALQSLMRISYAVFCLKKKRTNTIKHVFTKH